MTDNNQLTLSPDYLLNREQWRAYMKTSQHNPAIMYKAAMDYLAAATNGKLDYVDASNPPTLIAELAVQLHANALNYFAEADKKHYPVLATKMEDLYHHLNGELYRNRFARPAVGIFQFFFILEEILREAVESNIPGIRKILLPRGTMVNVDGVIYTLLSAIEIRVNQYDTVQVVYSKDYLDAYENIQSNILEYFFKRHQEGDEYLVVEIPMMQLGVTRKVSDVTHKGNMFNEVFAYPDQFAMARVYIETTEGQVKEIKTTHSDAIYDPNEITARLSVLSDNLLHVDIPIIYYNKGLMPDTKVIVEIYTTKGQVNYPTKSMAEKGDLTFSFDEEFGTKVADSAFTAPLSILQVQATAIADTIGGNNGLTFDTLKKWVIQGGQYDEKPITHANIRMKGDIEGYGIVADIDHVTNRIFQATREIEQAAGSEFSRGAGCSIESVVLKLEDIAKHPHVADHGERMTILPSALFKTSNGLTSLLSTSEIPQQRGSNVDEYISKINTLEYIYTPFHYCLDMTNNGFKARAYYMDKPEYISHNYIDSNQHVQILVSVDKANIYRKKWGYSVIVVTRSGEDYKQLNPSKLFAQLAYLPSGQLEPAFVNGEFIGLENDNPVFEFRLETTFDFTDKNEVILNNFNILTLEKRLLPCKLKDTFNIFFGVYDLDVGNYDLSEINKKAGLFLLEYSRKKTILAQNSIKLQLGHALTNLWSNVRTTESLAVYKTHETNVPLTYTERVYKLDSKGLPVFKLVEGKRVFEVIHEIGDPVLDDKGNPVFKHRIGDVVLDEKGMPVLKAPRSAQRIVDLFFIDGIYYFSTSQEDIDYVNSIPNTVVNWLEGDIQRFQRIMMENTQILYVPKRTMGYVSILVENGIEKTIFNRLPFKVKYYLTNRAYLNHDLKQAITKMTSEILNAELRKQVISRDVIEQRLRETAGDENVLGVTILDMGINSDTNTFTVLGAGNQCSVRRKIALLSDGKLKVKEDISIEFVNHEAEFMKQKKQGALI